LRKYSLAVIALAMCLSLFMYPKTYALVREGVLDAGVAVWMSLSSRDGARAAAARDGRTRVVFMFDDGWESVYRTAYPLLKRYGCRGSVGMICGMARQEGYMKYAQLAVLYMDGWDILNHSYSHAPNMYERSEELLRDFQRARDWLEHKGFSEGMDMAIVPYGECNPYLIRLLMINGYHSVRTSDNILLFSGDDADYYHVKTIHMETDLSVEAVKEQLAEGRREERDILLNLHKLAEGADPANMTYSPQKLEELLAYLKENEAVFEVVTYTELLER